MKGVSILELSELTGISRETVRKRLGAMSFQEGPQNSKLYNSAEALAKIFGKDSNGVTPQQAQTDLAVARKLQIELDMEVTRKDRIPLDDVTAINDEIFSNMAATFKAHEGKTLTPELIREIFSQTREIGNKLKVCAT